MWQAPFSGLVSYHLVCAHTHRPSTRSCRVCKLCRSLYGIPKPAVLTQQACLSIFSARPGRRVTTAVWLGVFSTSGHPGHSHGPPSTAAAACTLAADPLHACRAPSHKQRQGEGLVSPGCQGDGTGHTGAVSLGVRRLLLS